MRRERRRRVSKQEIAGVLEAFTEAFGNGDTATLATYWSSTCSAGDVQLMNGLSPRLALLLPGAYELSIDPEALVIDQADGEHVTVPLEQPEGALVATLGGAPIEEEIPIDIQESVVDQESFFFEEPVTLAREDGEWKVDSCLLFGTEEDEEEEEEEGNLPLTQPPSDTPP